MDRNEAIKEVRSFIGQLTEGCQEAILALVPELAESEDERNWKAVMEYVKDDALRDWLEKQKEPKPAEWSEEDENKIESIKGLIATGKFDDTNTIRLIWDTLNSLCPRQVGKIQFSVKAEVWTPTEAELRDLKQIVKQNKGNALGGNLETLYDELCRLQPQPQWSRLRTIPSCPDG